MLLVIIGHTLVFRLGGAYRWTQFASLGVLIFFTLSGFLITGLLCSEERRLGQVSLKAFYMRRAFRILPAFLVFILVVSLLVRLRLVLDTSWRTIIVSILFVKNIFGSGVTLGHLWSLSLEEQFYLIWPILFRAIGRRRLFAPVLGLIIGIALYRGVAIQLAPYDYEGGIFELRSDFRMDSILVGCALALFFDRRSGQAKKLAAASRWVTHPVWLVPFLLYWTLRCDVPSLWSVYLSVQTVLVVCLLFHIIAFQGSVIDHVLGLRWLRFVGLVSYSLYLWQQLFLVASVPSWGFVRQLPYCLGFAGGAAVLSYFFVERPFLRLKARFSGAR